jgi:hypothetical protein
MNRSTRVAGVLVVLAVLTMGQVGAVGFGESPRAMGWMEAAIEWVSGLLGMSGGEGLESAVAADGGGSTTQSGGCIDPWGKPKPCPVG